MTQNPKNAAEHIAVIAAFPEKLAALVAGLTVEQLTTAYVPDEWTIAQNIHHLADSHMNSYVRLKLILTENNPPLKGYDQDVWAALPDAADADIAASMTTLHGLHRRWVMAWEQVKDSQWNRTGHHSEIGEITLAELLPMYSAHCEAHIQQITEVLQAAGLD